MSALVHIPSRRELPAQREANSPRGKEQRGRYGFHRSDELGDNNQFVAAVPVMLGVEGEAKASASHVLDFPKPGHERVQYDAGVGKSAVLFCNKHGRLPSRPRDAHWFFCDSARGRSDFLTHSKRQSYRGLNATPVIAADTSGHRNIQRAA